MADEKVIPSLFMSAYYACNSVQLIKFHERRVPRVDMQNCCDLLFKFVKLNSADGVFDPLGDRRSMFDKLNDCHKYAFGCICNEAASNGHVGCLKFARQMGCPWDGLTCSIAAALGHLDCLVYAHENGCQWDTNTCSSAAYGGHLECLVYARNKGCPWNEDTCIAAENFGRTNCLRYALANGCPRRPSPH